MVSICCGVNSAFNARVDDTPLKYKVVWTAEKTFSLNIQLSEWFESIHYVPGIVWNTKVNNWHYPGYNEIFFLNLYLVQMTVLMSVCGGTTKDTVRNAWVPCEQFGFEITV